MNKLRFSDKERITNKLLMVEIRERQITKLIKLPYHLRYKIYEKKLNKIYTDLHKLKNEIEKDVNECEDKMRKENHIYEINMESDRSASEDDIEIHTNRDYRCDICEGPTFYDSMRHMRKTKHIDNLEAFNKENKDRIELEKQQEEFDKQAEAENEARKL